MSDPSRSPSDTPRQMGETSFVAEASARYSETVRLVETRDALPAPLGLVPLGDADRILLTPIHALRLRKQLTQAAQLLGWYGERLDALLDAANAIAEGALAHGVGGELQLRATPDGRTLQVWVHDPEPNVQLSPALARALAGCDQVTWHTDDTGTVWVIEQRGESGAA